MSRLVPGREVVLAYLTVPGGPDPPSMVEIGAAGGFDGVTIRAMIAGLGSASAAEIRRAASVAETLARVRSTGVAVSDVEYLQLKPTTAVAEMEPLLEVAGALGSRSVTVMCADADRERAIERYGELCDLAASYGVCPALEFCAYTQIPTLAAAWEVVSRAARPNGGIAVDSHHLRRSGGTLEELRALVRTAPAWFPTVHVSDAVRQAPASVDELARESRTDRLLPGDGELAPEAVVAALPTTAAVHVEAPVISHAVLPPEAVARRAADAVQDMFGKGGLPV